MEQAKLYNEGSLLFSIPAHVDNLKLNPFEFRLYLHLLKIGGTSNQGTRLLATRCSMSVGSVSKAKAGLLAKNLITIIPGNKEIAAPDEIRVLETDFYPVHWVNTPVHDMNAYRNNKPQSQSIQSVHSVNTPVHQTNTPVHAKEREKEKEKKKEKEKESNKEKERERIKEKEREKENSAPEVAAKIRDPFLHSFLDLLELDWRIFTQKDWAVLQAELRPFRNAGETIERVALFKAWYYANHWKGMEGQKPSMRDVKENWATAFLPPKEKIRKESNYESKGDRNLRRLQELQHSFETDDFWSDNNPIQDGPRLLGTTAGRPD